MFTRTKTFDILEGAQEFPIVALLGARQSGKTVLAQQIFDTYSYVSLEDIELRSAATHNPRTFVKAHKAQQGLIIDDFHYVPELLSYLQEEGFTQKGEYILCGPHNSYTREMVVKPFEGNVSLHTLFPLSLRELINNYSLPSSVDHLLYKGLHPAMYSSEQDAHELYRAYISTYIDTDVRHFGQVDNVTTFHTFLKACARSVGEVVNITALANEAAISDHTARRWLALLEDHQQIFLVKPYPEDFGKRLIKSPKLYFYNPGLVCCLLGIPQDQLSFHSLKGALFESLILSELSHWTSDLYFWKDKTRQIDCVIKEGDLSIPLGIQHAHTFEKDRAYWHKLSSSTHHGYCIHPESEARRAESLGWSYLHPLYKELFTIRQQASARLIN